MNKPIPYELEKLPLLIGHAGSEPIIELEVDVAGFGNGIQFDATSLLDALNDIRAQAPHRRLMVSLPVGMSALQDAMSANNEPIKFYNGRVMVARKELGIYLDGRYVAVSPGEYGIVRQLAEKKGEACDRDNLYEAMSGYIPHASNSKRSVDVLVSRIRQKIPAESIRTVRGVGYLALDAAQ